MQEMLNQSGNDAEDQEEDHDVDAEMEGSDEEEGESESYDEEEGEEAIEEQEEEEEKKEVITPSSTKQRVGEGKTTLAKETLSPEDKAYQIAEQNGGTLLEKAMQALCIMHKLDK